MFKKHPMLNIIAFVFTSLIVAACVSPPSEINDATPPPEINDASSSDTIGNHRSKVVTISAMGEPVGSGVLFRRKKGENFEDGYLILTNEHVVRGRTSFSLGLAASDEDRECFVSKENIEKLGDDAFSDLAVLRYKQNRFCQRESTDYFELDLEMPNLRVGERVYAVGSPGDYDHTVTSGIVSAIDRRIPNEPFVKFIQIDATVNYGNSGGALINSSGQFIGSVIS